MYDIAKFEFKEDDEEVLLNFSLWRTKIKNLGLISVDVFMQNNLQLWKQEFTELKDVNFILLYILVFLVQKLSNKQE